MNNNHRELISISLTVAIVALALFIIHRFIPSIIWAAIFAIATYPAYEWFKRPFGRHRDLAALLFTLFLSLVFILPLSWLVSVLVKESQLLINYLHILNREGAAAPGVLKQIPVYGNELIKFWNENIGKPGSLRNFIANLHVTLTPFSYYIRQIGYNLAHRGVQLGFTVLTLFFFFRDGDMLYKQIHHVGEYCLGERWFRFAARLPSALRATVNGTIVVGIGVGILMGICYLLVGFPAPTLIGFLTALAAMIPFVVPFVFITVALILVVGGSLIGALVVLIWGTLVMFVADHFVKPVLIGGTIQLPFLAVLFGILGGVETLGLLGLFVGPIIMVLFITLWQESGSVSN